MVDRARVEDIPRVETLAPARGEVVAMTVLLRCFSPSKRTIVLLSLRTAAFVPPLFEGLLVNALLAFSTFPLRPGCRHGSLYNQDV